MQRIRANMSRKIALIAVFTLVLTGSGLASLAQINDNITATINASVTTIDYKANGSKAAVFTIPAGTEPGEVVFLPLRLSNEGTGYLNTTASAAVTQNVGSQLVTDSKAVSLLYNIPAAGCTSSNTDLTPLINWNTAGPVDTPLFDNQRTIPAGEFLDICLVWKVGTEGVRYPNNSTTFQVVHTLLGWYP